MRERQAISKNRKIKYNEIIKLPCSSVVEKLAG